MTPTGITALLVIEVLTVCALGVGILHLTPAHCRSIAARLTKQVRR